MKWGDFNFVFCRELRERSVDLVSCIRNLLLFVLRVRRLFILQKCSKFLFWRKEQPDFGVSKRSDKTPLFVSLEPMLPPMNSNPHVFLDSIPEMRSQLPEFTTRDNQPIHHKEILELPNEGAATRIGYQAVHTELPSTSRWNHTNLKFEFWVWNASSKRKIPYTESYKLCFLFWNGNGSGAWDSETQQKELLNVLSIVSFSWIYSSTKLAWIFHFDRNILVLWHVAWSKKSLAAKHLFGVAWFYRKWKCQINEVSQRSRRIIKRFDQFPYR